MTNKESETEQNRSGRREALKIIGGSALALSAVGLAGCSGGDSSSGGTSNAMDEAAEAAAEAANEIQDAANEAIETVENTVDDAMDTVEEATEEVVDATNEALDETQSAVEEAADSGGLPRLAESDPQAQALGYVNNASSVDSNAQPRYQAGQACRNCSLFTTEEGVQWGPCSIFPGKAVNADGWCSVYAPRA